MFYPLSFNQPLLVQFLGLLAVSYHMHLFCLLTNQVNWTEFLPVNFMHHALFIFLSQRFNTFLQNQNNKVTIMPILWHSNTF